MINFILLTIHVPCRVRLSDIAGDFSQGSTILGVAKEGSFDSKGIRDRPLGFHLLQQVGIPAIHLESWILIPILAIEGSAEIQQLLLRTCVSVGLISKFCDNHHSIEANG